MHRHDFTIFDSNPFAINGEFSNRTFELLMGLSDQEIRLLIYIAHSSRLSRVATLKTYADNDFKIYFDIDDAVKSIHRSKQRIGYSINRLLENKIIARTKRPDEFYIDPQFLFFGAITRLQAKIYAR